MNREGSGGLFIEAARVRSSVGGQSLSLENSRFHVIYITSVCSIIYSLQ